MKGWTCCNKKVISFEEFLTLPGCTLGKHEPDELRPEKEKTKPASSSNASDAPLGKKKKIRDPPQSESYRVTPKNSKPVVATENRKPERDTFVAKAETPDDPNVVIEYGHPSFLPSLYSFENDH